MKKIGVYESTAFSSPIIFFISSLYVFLFINIITIEAALSTPSDTMITSGATPYIEARKIERGEYKSSNQSVGNLEKICVCKRKHYRRKYECASLVFGKKLYRCKTEEKLFENGGDQSVNDERDEERLTEICSVFVSERSEKKRGNYRYCENNAYRGKEYRN